MNQQNFNKMFDTIKMKEATDDGYDKYISEKKMINLRVL